MKSSQIDYKVLCWCGNTNNTPLTPIFDIDQIRGRRLIIKRISFHYYATDGNNSHFRLKSYFDNRNSDYIYEQIPLSGRISNTSGVEIYGEGLKPTIKINDIPVGLFPLETSPTNFGYPLDLSLDNLNYEFQNPIDNVEISVDCLMYSDTPSDGVYTNPNVKVIMEVYLK